MYWYTNTGLVFGLLGGSVSVLFILLVLSAKWELYLEEKERQLYEELAEETGYNNSKAAYEKFKQGR